MSIARHHAEWLSLIEVSGPFLSMPVLMRVFPQGLDAHDPELSRTLRMAYDEWADNQLGARPDPAIHTQWLRFVLANVLEMPREVLAEGPALPPGLHAHIVDENETLRPDIALVSPGDRKPRLLIKLYPQEQDLEKAIAGHHWKASPATRMMELLRNTNVRIGLVTNGERWMLVDAPPNETTGFASWYAALWLEEPVTLRAFRSLLRAQRFFGVPDDEMLEALLSESASNQQEVTDQLGYQVRRAVEVLVQSLDRIDKDKNRQLLAVFRVVYEGVQHQDMRLPAYGGHLFDPDRYPFLEGRIPGTSWRDIAAEPLLINNRTRRCQECGPLEMGNGRGRRGV